MESLARPFVMNAFQKLLAHWKNREQSPVQHLSEDLLLDLNDMGFSSSLPTLFDGFPYQQQTANTASPATSDAQKHNANVPASETAEAPHVPADSPTDFIDFVTAPEELLVRAVNEKYYETEERLWFLQNKLRWRRDIRREEENPWRSEHGDDDDGGELSLDLRYIQRCMTISKEAVQAEKEHEEAYETRVGLELAYHEHHQLYWPDYDDQTFSSGPGPFPEEKTKPQKLIDRIHRWMEEISPSSSNEEPEEDRVLEWDAKSLGVDSNLTYREDCVRYARKIRAHREEGERLRESFGLAREDNLVERYFDTERGRRFRYARSM